MGNGGENELPSTVVLTSVYRGLLRASLRCGHAVPDELHRVEEQHEGIEFIEREHVVRLWEDIATETDPMFGLRLGLAIDLQFLGVIGALLYSCADLRSALFVLEDFGTMLREPSNMHVGIDGDELPAVSHSEFPHWHLRSLTATGATIRLVSEITGHQVRSPEYVQFTCAPEAPLGRYTQLLGCPVTFEQRTNAVLFSEVQGRTELLYADRPLEDRLRKVASQSLHSRSRDSIQARVRDLLIAEPALSKEQVADRLEMSSRTLHRLLETEGVSFSVTSSAARDHLARAALRDTHASLAEIAAQLGFADESSFSRAFKRWTGMSPGEFRAHSR